jgi:hypothetical protein
MPLQAIRAAYDKIPVLLPAAVHRHGHARSRRVEVETGDVCGGRAADGPLLQRARILGGLADRQKIIIFICCLFVTYAGVDDVLHWHVHS